MVLQPGAECQPAGRRGGGLGGGQRPKVGRSAAQPTAAPPGPWKKTGRNGRIPGMRYQVELKPRARKDLRRIPKPDAARVVDALEKLEDDLTGDVKRLAAFAPEYRLRVGDYRVLFEIRESNRVVVYRVRHRRESYRP